MVRALSGWLLVLALAGCVSSQSGGPRHYQPTPMLMKSLPELSADLKDGSLTASALVEAYLERIEKVDRAGPALQSVLTINPNALQDARALDAWREAGKPLLPLHGIPVLLKDNIESKDPMATTAGSMALARNVTERDAPLVAGLRAAGAVILGKTNLSQWANFRSERSISGWSSLGGQVRNPHMLDRSPCGSSSGSGAAVAASLAAGAVGTETNGSIICPANVNGVVGFKPTVGLVSQQFIVPISSSQDTAGPMTKTVTGAAMMLTAMATSAEKQDYVAKLDQNSLKGARIGVLRFSQGSNPDIVARFNEALEALVGAGAEMVDIDEFDGRDGAFYDRSYDVLKYEFKATLNDYLASTPRSVETRSLVQLIAFNNAHADVELALFDQGIFVESADFGSLNDDKYLVALASVQLATRTDGIDALLKQYDVDVLVSPSGPVASRVDPVNGDVWPDWVGAGGIAAVAGYPHLSVPMGGVHGVPLGVSFIAAANDDAKLLSFGYAFEQRTKLRMEPSYLRDAEQREEIRRAMIPDRSN